MIAIVGGGISGLFLLHLLNEAGVEAILFEAADLPGGVMRTAILEGPRGRVAADLGPQRIRLTPDLRAIVQDLGLEDSVRHAAPGLPFTIFHDGRLHPAPTSPMAAVTTRLVSWPGKLRALADLVTAPPKPDESVACALQRKLGSQIYRRLAGPILGGLYASKPDEMDARHTLLPILHRTGSRRSLLLGLLRASRGEGPPIISFADGLGVLPRALARRHAGRVRTSSPVRSIEAEGEGYRVATDEDALTVREVILALPAGNAGVLLNEMSPSAAERLGALRYNPLAIVPLVVPPGLEAPDVGSGFKMTLDDPRPTRGVTSHDALFGRSGLFTAFLGGRGQETVVESSDMRIMDMAVSDFEAVTGVTPEPLLVHRTAMPAWDRSWVALDGLELPPGFHLCAAFSDRPGVTGRLEQARRLTDRLTRR